MRLGLLYTIVRHEERLLLDAAKAQGIEVDPVRDTDLVMDTDGQGLPGDVLLCRSVSTTRGLYALRAARAAGLPAVNRYETAATCSDKTETSLALRRAGVATPEIRVAFGRESALQALDQLGYPAVVKPTQGSWARLVSRVDDRHQAEQILEHREALPNPTQHVYYLQQYIDTRFPGDAASHGAHDGTGPAPDGPGTASHRDIRAFVVGDETIAAVHRISEHWVTNTARGARTEAFEVTDELDDLCQRAAQAVGGGVLAMDLMHTPDGLVVHEVNHTMEFRNSIAPTGVDIPGRIVQYCMQEARR